MSHCQPVVPILPDPLIIRATMNERIGHTVRILCQAKGARLPDPCYTAHFIFHSNKISTQNSQNNP